MKKNNNVSAFPNYETVYGFTGEKTTVREKGMSIRDWFAGQALIYFGHVQAKNIEQGEYNTAKDIAQIVYEIADEMLKKEKIKDSQKYVSKIFEKLRAGKYAVENVSVTVEAGVPRVSLADIGKMKKTIGGLLKIDEKRVGITFTSGEGLTPFGQGKGIKAMCAVLLCQ